MSDENFNFYLDLGSSKIRAVAFNKFNKDEKFIVEKGNILSLKKDVVKDVNLRRLIKLW